jgi:hypothetical protein
VNQGSRGDCLMKKTECRKSLDTVPLNLKTGGVELYTVTDPSFVDFLYYYFFVENSCAIKNKQFKHTCSVTSICKYCSANSIICLFEKKDCLKYLRTQAKLNCHRTC